MFLSSKATLKISNNEKLHISRRPGIISWFLLALSLLIFIGFSRHLTDNVFTLTVSIIGGIMFGLDTLGGWEDFVLDKSENRATFTRYNWCEKLCGGKAERKSTVSMKLTEIRHVGVSIDLGLFVLEKSGKTTSLSTTGLSREEIQIMRQEIHNFLNSTRIECLDKLPTDLHDHLLVPSDSDDEIYQQAPPSSGSKSKDISLKNENFNRRSKKAAANAAFPAPCKSSDVTQTIVHQVDAE